MYSESYELFCKRHGGRPARIINKTTRETERWLFGDGAQAVAGGMTGATLLEPPDDPAMLLQFRRQYHRWERARERLQFRAR